jgi:hypothetical protein
VDHADIRESTPPREYPDGSYHQTTVRVAALPVHGELLIRTSKATAGVKVLGDLVILKPV